LHCPRPEWPTADPNLNYCKEFIMNQTTQTGLELQVVELGDAKEVTMGDPVLNHGEDDPEIPGKF
jgi:hypothetical protein